MQPNSKTLNPKDWIAGVERGLKVLESFGEAASRMTAQQMADRTGLTRTAARRQLLTLEHLGYLASDSKLFWLTPRVLTLAQGYIDSSRLARIVQPYLQRMAQGLQETTYLSVFDNDSVIYLARQGPSRAKNIGYGTGERVPAALTAAGLMLLSYLPQDEQANYLANYEIRNFTSQTISDKTVLAALIKEPRVQGFAVSDGQVDIELRGIAVPLLDHKGVLHGALSVTVSLLHETREAAIKRLLPTLRDTAVSLRNMI
jgi:IclR family transcriptional regulator, pca regulon regulatory protein